MAVIIAVANQKGGVGKTTTTANLGASLAKRGRRVLLVDMDPQGNLTSAVGVSKAAEQTVANALLDHRAPLPAVHVQDGHVQDGHVQGGHRQDGRGRLDVVPATLALASAETALMNKLGREQRLRDQIARLGDAYDYVLIDTPPSLGLLTINALVAADHVLIPTEARFFSLQGLQMIEESIEEVLYLNPKLQVLGILLSKLDRRLREEKQVAEYVRERWGARVFETEIATSSKVLEAGSAGVTVCTYAGAERAAGMYARLAEEVISRGQP